MAASNECSPVGLAIVAPPKSGSTFIAALIKALAFEAATCRIASTQFRCSTTVIVGCPTNGARCHRHGRNGKSDLRMLCTWGSQPDNNRSFALPAGCCAVVRPSATSDLLDAPAGDGSTPVEQFPHKRDCQARSVDDWLAEQPRAWAWGPPRAHLLEQHGYIVGPIRSLPPAPEQPSQASQAFQALAALCSLGWSSPSYPGSPLPRLRTVVVLHVRHPLETLVSHYYCVSSARTCPRRHALRAATTDRLTDRATNKNRTTGRGGLAPFDSPPHDPGPHFGPGSALDDSTIKTQLDLDDFLLGELEGHTHTSTNRLLGRLERLASWLETARALHARGLLELRDLGRLETPPKELVDTELHPWFHDQGTHERPASKCEEPEDWGARSPVHVQRPLVVLSRYEAMTADFDGWFKALLDTLPDGMVARAGASRAQIHRAMLALFRRDFVADGRHRHSLVPGSNLARLLPASVHRLQGHARLVSVMDRLGYDFQMTVKV